MNKQFKCCSSLSLNQINENESCRMFVINKNDSKYLSKLQVKKAQFLYENDYFIWNEAEMYLRYHDIFSTISSNSDALYEKVCKTTRVIFNLIHDVHFKNTGSNAAHLKFYEVLDAWGSLSEYLKKYGKFPKVFLDWFESIFEIYSSINEINGQKVKFVSHKHLTCLYLFCGVNSLLANQAYNKITFDLKYPLTFNHLLHLIKSILISDEPKHHSYLLVPKLQDAILENKIKEMPYEDVIRNYDYFERKEHIYSNLNEYWNNSPDRNNNNKKPMNIDETSIKEMISEAVSTTSGFCDLTSTANTQPTVTISIKKQKSSSIPVPIIKNKTLSNSNSFINNQMASVSPNNRQLPLTLFTLNSNQITYSLNNNKDKITIKSSMNNENFDKKIVTIKKPDRNRRCLITRKSSSNNELNKIPSLESNNQNNTNKALNNSTNNENLISKTESTFSLNEFRKEFKKLPQHQAPILNNDSSRKKIFKNNVNRLNNNHRVLSQNDITYSSNKTNDNYFNDLLIRKRFSSLNKIPQLQFNMKKNRFNDYSTDRSTRQIAKKHNQYVKNIENLMISSSSSSSSLSSVSTVSKSISNIIDTNKFEELMMSRKNKMTRNQQHNNSLRKSLEINLTNEDENNNDNNINDHRKQTENNRLSTNRKKSSILSSVDTLYDIDDENNNDEYDSINLTTPSANTTSTPPFRNPQSIYKHSPNESSIHPHLFTVNDYKLMYEIIRKLKPYINNCIKLEVRNYFEKLIQKEQNNLIS